MSSTAGRVWPLFAGVPEEELRTVLEVARRRTFDRGEVVFHRGDPADTLHLVVRGHFAARIVTPLGDAAILDVHRPGDAFGELALTGSDAHRSATVSALENGETRSIHRDDFARLQRRHPELNSVLVALLSEKVRRASERLVEAHYVDAETRVRRRLLDLLPVYSEGEVEGECEVPLTQEDLAELAGTS
ncbi:MAG TPA: cyclic nucleotide-binding domain-containing protein, partial [Gaiellaceae bacterium]|nr:cyclic nucleotide-binding domain-containing protein [Gaiellaceae bacterium]